MNPSQSTPTETAVSQERSGKMSSQLSPRAKREMLLSPGDKKVSVLVTISTTVERTRFTQSVQQIGGAVVTWSDTTNLVTLTIPARQLEALAGMDGVVYVEAGGHYRD